MTAPIALLAFAQPSSGGGSALLPLLLEFAAIFAIFYFIMIRPQQKQKREHEQRLREMRKGDEVVTAGGVVGEVIHIKTAGESASMEDRITIKSGEARLVVERGRIARVASRTAEASPAA
ncbi:MAG TPA: preprotein translocase subunit YajC [Gemmatimonadaceae bacterium]|nr:preprotein translocase subunit YajC [Gemmatimonadaceae bacterium]